MALEGAQLQVTVGANVAPLLSSMNEASAAVSTSADKMASAFKAAGLSSTEAASAMKNLQFTADESAAALRNVGIAAETASAEVRNVGPASDEGFKPVSSGADKAKTSITDARIATQGLASDLGVRMPRALTTMLARMPEIGPAIASAFNVIAVVAFLEIVDQVAKKIRESIEDLEGWGAAQQAAYKAAEAANFALLSANVVRSVEAGKQNQIGLEGMAKHKASLDDLVGAEKKYGDEAAESLRRQIGLEGELKNIQTQRNEAAFDPTRFDYAQLGKDRDEANRRISEEIKLQGELGEKIRQIKDVEIPAERKTTDADQAKDSLALATAKSDAAKAIGLADVAFQQQLARQRYEAEKLTIDQEVEALRAAEDKKFAIEQAFEARSRQVLQQKHAETGEDITPQLEKLNGDARVQAETHQAALSAIDATGAAERKRINDAAEQAEIDSTEKSALAGVAISEKWIEQQRSMQRISIAEETALLTTAENERHDAQSTALQQRLKIAQEEPEKNKALVISLNSDLEQLEIEHQGALSNIQADGAAKIAEKQMQSYDRQVSASMESANRQLEVAIRADQDKVRNHQASVLQGISAESASLNQWYAQQLTILSAAEAFAARTYGKESEQYAELQRKKAQLDQEYAAKTKQSAQQVQDYWMQAYQRVTTTINADVLRWSLGQQTFSQTTRNLTVQLVSAVEKDILQLGEKWAAHYLLVEGLEKISWVQRIAETVTGAATKHATEATAAVAGIQSSAAAGGAAAFASVIEALPFPVNVAVAPGVAAASVAQIEAFTALGAFETGGLAKATGPYILHAGEGVMTARQTAAIDRAGDSTTNNNNGGARHFHQTNHIHHNGTSLSDADLAKTMRRLGRKGLLALS